MKILLFQINALATLCTRVLPALLPSCAIYNEDGANFLHGDLIHKLMEISTDGFIQLCNDTDCSHSFHVSGNVIVVECKCPFPKEDGITVHYEIPVYYACQLLAGMKVKHKRIVLSRSCCRAALELNWCMMLRYLLLDLEKNFPYRLPAI